jgi:exopolysaccharide biosynthesis polyprenyl glycosylphosphotransferase
MTSKSLSSIVRLKPDLRSSHGATIQRGISIRFLRVMILIVMDAISLTMAWKLAALFGTPLESPWTDRLSFLSLNVAIQIGILFTSGLYKAGVNRRNYAQIFKAISLAELLLLVIAFLYEPQKYVSRSTFLLAWLFSLVLVCLSRVIFDAFTKVLRKQGVVRHPVFLIVEPEEEANQVNLIEQENCYKIMGVGDSTCLDLLNREDTFNCLRNLGISEAFVSWNSIRNRLHVCWNFQTAGITLRILPNRQESHHPKSVIWMLGDVPCLTIPAPILVGSDFWLKRSFDFCAAVVLILLVSPLYLYIAVKIKLDSKGPVFFRQERMGLHGKKFKIWKFRTMVTNADKLQEALETQNEIKDGVLFKLKDDPRVTRIGQFLRRYSLDELPQLFNVVVGEMSLVGPRPLPMRDVERFQRMHFIRQEVLPGITGLWQVSGRSDIDNFEDAVKLDISYIENWSIWLDLKILLQTVGVVLRKTGAY